MSAVDVLRYSIFMKDEDEFTRDKWGWVIVILNFFMALNSTYFFLARMNTGVDGWLMMNSCAPSIFFFVIGYLLRSPIVMTASMVMLLRWGTAGLFIFSWDGFNIIAQVGHIFMTFACIYFLYRVIGEQRWKSLLIGLIIGVIIVAVYSVIQIEWFNNHPGILEKLFSGDLTIPK